MEIIVKKTTELSDQEIAEIYILFEEVFGKRRDIHTFREEYSNTPMGYSYHSLLINETGKIVGFHSCMPFYYLKADTRFVAALGIDSMIHPQYRDFFNFKDMVQACQRRLADEGCKLRIGFPNDSSFPVLKKGLKHQEIGSLHTYILLRNIGAYKWKLRHLNVFSRFFSECMILASYLSRSQKVRKFIYQKERASFDSVRYKWFGGAYQHVSDEKKEFRYRVMEYEGCRVAFLLDVNPMSRTFFEQAVRYIYRKEIRNIDMIMYVGSLDFIPVSLIRIPHKYEPKHFHFTCYSMSKDYFDKSLLDLKNWDVNLSNYDLL